MAQVPAQAITPASGRWAAVVALCPGLLLALGLALAAIGLRDASGLAALNPVVVALVGGMAVRAALTPRGLPGWLRPGAAFAVRPLLRAAIVLLGLQVTTAQLLSVGAGALGLAVAAVALTVPFAMWLGARLGVAPALAQLIGAGTGICGASAVVATNQVAGGTQEDVTYALAIVTLFGTAALLLYPTLGPLLHLSPRGYGMWAGSSIHEVVQAVGAAAAGGPVAAEIGTITKLARVVLLAPAILALGAWARRGGAAGELRTPMPWFAFGFLAMIAAASSGAIPATLLAASRQVVPVLLATSVAALGVTTELRTLRARGWRPLVLGCATTLFIALLGLGGAALLCR